MNPNKVCFIYCVNDDTLLQESLKYLTYLNIPEGFEIDVVTVREAKSMTAGYNYAMQQTDAKYKVYLHQDTLIINRNFISDCVQLFDQDSRLGMLGSVGSSYLPENGIWWESHQKFGMVYESHTGKMDLLAFQEVEHEYAKVVAIDGFLMITQYDIPWSEDLFQGWHFYDLSQCAEFIKAGYEVGVPRQEKPWAMHDCGLVNMRNGFEEAQNVFLKEYKELLKEHYKIYLGNQVSQLEKVIERTTELDRLSPNFSKTLLSLEIIQLTYEMI